jgi:hypothetical protein
VCHSAYLNSAICSHCHKNLKYCNIQKQSQPLAQYAGVGVEIKHHLLFISALDERFGGLLHALATLPQGKIPRYPACLDRWRQLGMDHDSSQSLYQLNCSSSSHSMRKLFLVLIICCMKRLKGNLCASLAFTLFTQQNLCFDPD